MTTGTYSFKRVGSAAGYLSSNRASTDALNALQTWAVKEGRSYKICLDNDDELVAELSFDEKDAKAGGDLDQACDKCGVERCFVK